MSLPKTSYKLIYFNIKGRAEPIRLILAFANVTFEDFGIEISEWPAWKSKFPWGQVPVLEVTNGGETEVLTQTNAICRFLSRRFNINGENAFEEAKCDELVDAINDYTKEWKKMFREVDDAKKSEIRETCLLVYTPFYLDRISKIKANNGRSKWLIGSKVTWADLYAYASLRNLEERATPQLLLNHPALQDFQREVSNIPKIKEFMKLRNSK